MKGLPLFLFIVGTLSVPACSGQSDPLVHDDEGFQCDSSYPDGVQALVRGHVMPNMGFETLDGEAFDLEQLRSCGDDKILVLEPFPLWCVGCRENLPFLTGLESAFGSKGLRVAIAVAEDTDHQPAKGPAVAEWLEHFAPGLEAWIDPEGQLHAYTSFQNLPMTLVIDLDSMTILLKLISGEDRDTSVALIEKLLSEDD